MFRTKNNLHNDDQMDNKIDNRIVITKVYNRASAYFMENSEVTRIRVVRPDSEFALGTVVMARVKKLIDSSGACFVDLGDNTDYFLQLPKDLSLITFGDTREHKKIKCEDIIMVQISSEAVKKKAPTVTYNISLNSRYFVIGSGKGISFSGKIDSISKKSIDLPDNIERISAQYRIIVRTACMNEPDPEILRKDLEALYALYTEVMRKAPISPLKSVIYKSDADADLGISDWLKFAPEEIVTDIPEYSERIKALAAGENINFRFYEDELLPLCKLYKLETAIDKSLSKQVYLKSGGFIIIEQGETLCAIDVNSGHNISGDKEEKSFEINLEAAEEIEKQLKIRNISGMILIDFINMKKDAHVRELISRIRDIIRTDDVACRYVDMTGLGLMELTRKRVLMSLSEQWRS